jgi:hypothetical protein
MEALTGQKITFKTVKGEPLELEVEDKPKKPKRRKRK